MTKPATRNTPGKQATTPPRDPKTLPMEGKQGDTIVQAKARAATKASVNAVIVVDAFQSNIIGKDVDVGELVADMQTKFEAVNAGDMTNIENMLVGQATALQTMFTEVASFV